MSLKITGSRELITPPKGDKGDKGEDGNSFTPKGQAYGHFDSSDDFNDALDQGQLNYNESFLVDDDEGGTAKVYTIAIRRIGVVDAEDGDAYTIVGTKHLWAATGHKWVDFGEIQGPPGEDGKPGDNGHDAELYKLQLTEGWARWEKYDSGWRLKCCIKGNAWFIRGGTQMSATSGTGYEEQRIRIRYNNNKQLHFEPIAGDGSWTDDVAGKYLEDDEYGSSSVGQPECIIVELIGKDISDHTQVLDALTIAITWDGEPGGKGGNGDPGPMGIPAGAYNSSARYERTSEIVPIVEHNGEYWYPRNIGVLTNSEPSANNNNWKKAENFEVMFVKILFAAFAKLGNFIVYNSYFFSQYGTLVYNNNGIINRTSIGSNNHNTAVGGKLPYAYFDGSTTNPTSGNYKFIPTLVLNALTGDGWFGGNKIHFNEDGSGWLANRNIEWDANGAISLGGGTSIFETDGSGSLAKGNIYWDEDGVGGLAGGTITWDKNGNIVAHGGNFENVTIKGLIKTPFQIITTNAVNFNVKNGYYAVETSSNVSQIGFNMDLEYEGNEMMILNTGTYNLGIWNLFWGTNAFALQKTEVRYVYLKPGAHLQIKAVRRRMLISSTSDDDCIWLVLNPSDFDITPQNGFYKITSKTFV